MSIWDRNQTYPVASAPSMTGLVFMLILIKNHLMGLSLTLFCGDPQEGDDIRVRVQSPYGAQSYLVLRRPPGG